MFNLNDKKIAILVANGFEQIEMTEPKKAFEKMGAVTALVSPEKGKVKGWNHTEWGDEFLINTPLSKASVEDYSALLLPGGVMNPDKLRINDVALQFVKAFFKANKPVAAICHGPWILINAAVIKGYQVTSWPSIKLDLMNAGAKWVDEKVVIDRNLVTSRKPEDLPQFIEASSKLFSGK